MNMIVCRKTESLLGKVFVSLAVVFLTLFVTSSYALQLDFQRRYQLLEAERQFAREEFAEARESFQQLAESAGSGAESAALLARAAVALGHQEEQFEAAMQEASELEHEPSKIYAIISLMALQSDWSGIVERFGEVTVEEWEEVRLPARPRGSEEELRTLFFIKRGRAFEQTGNYERAEQDLAAAADLAVSRSPRARPGLLTVLNSLAELRARRLDDAEGAFEAYKRIAEEGTGRGKALYLRAALRAARYLREQERYDEAIEMLKLMNPESRPAGGYWYGTGMLEFGRIYRAAGKQEEAEKTYAKILERPNVDTRYITSAARSRAEVLAEAGKTKQALDTYRALLEREDIDDAVRERAKAAIKELETEE